jgi:hypothetical protein
MGSGPGTARGTLAIVFKVLSIWMSVTRNVTFPGHGFQVEQVRVGWFG